MEKIRAGFIIFLLVFTGILSGCTSIEEQNNPPTLTIIAYPTFGYQPLNVSFQIEANDSDGFIQSYYIDFGDGTNSHDMNPDHTYHTYQTAGTYLC